MADLETTKLKVNAFLPQAVLAVIALTTLIVASFAIQSDWCASAGIVSACVAGIAGMGRQAISSGPPKD